MPTSKLDIIRNVIGSYKNDSDTVISPNEVSEYIQSVRFLEDILKFSKTCFFVVEYTNMSYLYCSPNVSDILGNTAEAYLRNGPLYTLSYVSQEDLYTHKVVHERIVELFAAAPEDERALMKFAFTLKLRIENGIQRQLLQNNFILKWSSDGRPLVKLFTLTDITTYKTSDDSIFFVSKIDGSGHQQILKQENFSNPSDIALTQREIEILNLSAKGLSNKEIAGKTLLNENTVKNHKKNIMKKLGTRNIAHAASLGSLYGFSPFKVSQHGKGGSEMSRPASI